MDGSMSEGATLLGRILEVAGSHLVMLLDEAAVAQRGDGAPRIQLGTLVKMPTAGAIVFGVVKGINVPMPEREAEGAELRLAELELIGEVGKSRTFQRGVSIFPSLSDRVYAATGDDLRLVYASPSVPATRIGTVHQDRSLPAYVMTDGLLGKHFAVLGTTGTGKSCAVALILQSILAQHGDGHVLLLDLHSEYAHAFGERAEVLDANTFQLPYWLFTLDELEEIVLAGSPDRRAESIILGDLVVAAKRLFVGDAAKAALLTVDSPVPYRMSDIDHLLDAAAGRLQKSDDPRQFVRLKGRLTRFRADPRYAFMFPPRVMRDNMTEILGKLFRIPVGGKPVTILDLSEIPSEVLNVAISVVCRMTFDFALWGERAVPILLVCEEAHRYCSQDVGAPEPAKQILARIAKEGRKHGISLCLVSQRPSELAPAVLSQCNTIFALRMSNSADQDFIRSALRESTTGLLDFLPALRNGEAIAMGEGVSVPVRLCFDQLPEGRRPRSGTASFSDAWSKDVEDEAFLGTVVERWRNQRR